MMMGNVALLLGKLPPYSNKHVVIEKKQSVHDIMREVLTAHRLFASDYDKIVNDFWQGDVYKTCLFLWNFCKRNIKYKVEKEESQTTKSPAAMLTQATGDCKHYAGFIGGVLDALVRSGKKINWRYRFAAYNGNGNTPEHVFIAVKHNGEEIWIDPVLKSFNERLQPTYATDKKIGMLTRISGIGSTQVKVYPISNLLSDVDYSRNPALYMAIQLLLKYSVMKDDCKINTWKLNSYKKNPQLYKELVQASQLIKQNAIGGLFDDIWRGVKVVALAPMRGAYLSLVAVNAFGYATKLKAAIYNNDNSFSAYKEVIKNVWQNKFGGQFSVLLNTVNSGAQKKAILGTVAPAAWAVTAAAIIAALTPIITAALRAKQQATGVDYNIDPTTGQMYGSPNVSAGPLDFIKNNPVLVAGGIAAIYFLTQNKKGAA